jgi:hypothetical protein
MGAVILTVAVWAVHFTIVYSFTAFACAREMASAVPWVVGAASVVAAVALVGLAAPAAIRARRASRLPDFLVLALGALAGMAVIWEASSLLGARACA